MDWIEWIGYAGAALVVLSFLVSSKLSVIRFINMFGAVMFVFYGILIGYKLPVIIPNVFIICIQFYYLFIKKEKQR